MKIGTRQRLFAFLPALLLAALLGAQTLQAAHLHADHPTGGDCLQCQIDTGQAALPSGGHAAAIPCAAGNACPGIALAPVATFYRLAARGPPALSC